MQGNQQHTTQQAQLRKDRKGTTYAYWLNQHRC